MCCYKTSTSMDRNCCVFLTIKHQAATLSGGSITETSRPTCLECSDVGGLQKEGVVSNEREVVGAIVGLRTWPVWLLHLYMPHNFHPEMFYIGFSLVDFGSISSGFYRWLDGFWAGLSGAPCHLSERSERRAAPCNGWTGCEWENGPSVTLRLSIFTHTSQQWILPFFSFFGLLLTLCALLITALVDWQTNADGGSAQGSNKGLALAQNR